MWKKKVMLFLWMASIMGIIIVTIVNHRPYFIMGGSTSVAPLMQTLMTDYPEDSEHASDLTYNSLGSDAAIIPVKNKIFSIGWLSKEYDNSDNNMISFVLSRDGMILVYNLPAADMGNDKPLDFTSDKVQEMYSYDEQNSNKKVYWRDLFPQSSAGNDFGWVKSSCDLAVIAYTRENGSGTRDVFNEKVLGKKDAYYPQARTVNSSTQMFGMAPGGVGYSSYSDKKQLNAGSSFAHIKMASWEGVLPSLETIKDSKYHLWRPFTGLLNINYGQMALLISFLRFLFLDSAPGHDKVDDAFGEANYAQVAVTIDDPVNNKLAQFLGVKNEKTRR